MPGPLAELDLPGYSPRGRHVKTPDGFSRGPGVRARARPPTGRLSGSPDRVEGPAPAGPECEHARWVFSPAGRPRGSAALHRTVPGSPDRVEGPAPAGPECEHARERRWHETV